MNSSPPPQRRRLRHVDRLGERIVRRTLLILDTLSLAAAVLVQATRPLTWRRTVQREFMRQCHLTAVLALPSVAMLGALTGAGMVFQAVYWLDAVGQLRLVAQLLVRTLVQEVGPLAVGVVLVGRSASAMAAELATMRHDGEIKALDAMGIDPMIHCVVPRVAALVTAAVGLTVFLITVALLSGFVLANMSGVGTGNLVESLNGVLTNIGPGVYLAVLIKSVLSGLIIGSICCREALLAEAVAGVPGILSRSFIEGLVAIFLITGLVSLML